MEKEQIFVVPRILSIKYYYCMNLENAFSIGRECVNDIAICFKQ